MNTSHNNRFSHRPANQASRWITLAQPPATKQSGKATQIPRAPCHARHRPAGRHQPAAALHLAVATHGDTCRSPEPRAHHRVVCGLFCIGLDVGGGHRGVRVIGPDPHHQARAFSGLDDPNSLARDTPLQLMKTTRACPHSTACDRHLAQRRQILAPNRTPFAQHCFQGRLTP